MPDNFREMFTHAMPFMVGASAGTDKLNIARIIETILTTGLIGVLAWLFLLPEFKAEMKINMQHLSKAVSELKVEMKAENKDIEQRLDNLSVEMVRDRFTRTDFENWRANHTDED